MNLKPRDIWNALSQDKRQKVIWAVVIISMAVTYSLQAILAFCFLYLAVPGWEPFSDALLITYPTNKLAIWFASMPLIMRLGFAVVLFQTVKPKYGLVPG